MHPVHGLRTSLRHASYHKSPIRRHTSRLAPTARHTFLPQASSSGHSLTSDTRRHAGNVCLLSTQPEKSDSPTDASSVQSGNATDKDDGVPMLKRPLGVLEKPSALKKTWDQTKEELMDQDKRMEKRKALCVELHWSRASSCLDVY